MLAEICAGRCHHHDDAHTRSEMEDRKQDGGTTRKLVDRSLLADAVRRQDCVTILLVKVGKHIDLIHLQV